MNILDQLKIVFDGKIEYWSVNISDMDFTVWFTTPEDEDNFDVEIPVTYTDLEGFCYLDLDKYKERNPKAEYGFTLLEIEVIHDVLQWITDNLDLLKVEMYKCKR